MSQVLGPNKSPRSIVLVTVAATLGILGVALYFLLRRSPLEERAPAVAPDTAPTTGSDGDPALASADTAGERLASGVRLDLGLPDGIAIPAGVRLPGHGKLRGRVLDRATGEALPGVRVDLLPLPPAGVPLIGRILRLASLGSEVEQRLEPIAVTGTDVLGEFVFEGVRTGTYFLEARGARHVPDSAVRARIAASGDGGPLEVFVRSGGRVLGQVLRPEGSPAAGAKVALSLGPTNVIEAARSGDVCYLEVSANEAGGFALMGVPAGDGYQITASGSGFALSHLTDVSVRAGEDTEIVLRTGTGATLEGRILSPAGAEPGARTGASTPLAGAHVGVVPRGLRDLTFVEEILRQTHAVSDASGRYQMHHVPAGEVDVLAIAPGHVAAKGPRAVVGHGSVSRAPDFELPQGPMVSGRVVDSSGAPLAGVHVRWNAIDWRNFDFDFTFAPLLAQAVEGFDYPETDADGRFTAGAFPGEKPYRIELFKLGYRDARHEWDPEAVPDGIEIVMSSGGSVEGIVMDAVRHEPVQSFTITGNDRIDADPGAPGRFNPFSGGELVEDPRGHFQLEGVEAGRSSLTFSAPGYLPERVDDLEVVEGELTRGVIVELVPGGTVRGRVHDKERKPIAGAHVFALVEGVGEPGESRRGRRRSAARAGPGILRDIPPGLLSFAASLGMLGDQAVLSKPDGTFELTGLEPGRVTVLASHRDYTTGKAIPVDLEAAGAASISDATPASSAPASPSSPQVEIELLRGGGVYGTAKDRFGRPVRGAIVLAMSPSNMVGPGGSRGSTGAGLHQGSTNEEGEYRIEHMSPGGYFLLLTRGDAALNPVSFLGTLNFDLITVPPEEMVEFDIVDTSSGACRVYGFVTSSGQPVGPGTVVALGFESESMLGVDFKLAQIRDDGSYEFAGLAPGEYQFQISPMGGRGRGGSEVQLIVDVPDLPEAQIDISFPEGGVEGVVVDDASGEPLPGAELVLTPEDQPAPSGLLGQLLSRESGSQRERSDERGEFRFERLQAGEYRLALRPPRDGQDGKHYAPPDPRQILVAENVVERGIELRLQPALALSGLVRRASGEPLQDVEVLATSVERERFLPERASTDLEGRFSIQNLAAGVYDLTANKKGFSQTTVKDFEVRRDPSGAAASRSAAGPAELEIVLREGVSVSVRVLAANGTPAAGATGRLVPRDPSARSTSGDIGKLLENLFSGEGVSDSKGLLELGQFGPGEYTLEVRRGLAQAPTQLVKLEEGAPVELRAHLP